MTIRKYTDSSLPNPTTDSVAVYPGEFNADHAVSRSNYRLLENDVFLLQNFLSMAPSSDWCGQIGTAFALVSASSALWSAGLEGEPSGSLSALVYTDYCQLASETYGKSWLPYWSGYRKLGGPTAAGSTVAGAYYVTNSLATVDCSRYEVPTSRCVGAMIRDHAEYSHMLLWQRTESDGTHRAVGVGNVSMWHADKVLDYSSVAEVDILHGCATVDVSTSDLLETDFGIVPKDWPDEVTRNGYLNMRRIRLDPGSAGDGVALWEDGDAIFIGINYDRVIDFGVSSLDTTRALITHPVKDVHYSLVPDSRALNGNDDRFVLVTESVSADMAESCREFDGNWTLTDGTIKVYSSDSDPSPVTRVAPVTFAGPTPLRFVCEHPVGIYNPTVAITAGNRWKTFDIAASAGTGGIIAPAGTVTVQCKNDQAFAISTSTGYHVVDVSVDSSSQGVIYAYTFSSVQAAHTIRVTAAINTYTLTYTAGANGSIAGSSPQIVNHGSSGSAVTANGNAGFHFVSWSDASTANPRTDSNVAGSITVTATFAAD